jgi:hypothetical protein
LFNNHIAIVKQSNLVSDLIFILNKMVEVLLKLTLLESVITIKKRLIIKTPSNDLPPLSLNPLVFTLKNSCTTEYSHLKKRISFACNEELSMIVGIVFRIKRIKQNLHNASINNCGIN